MVQVNFTPTYKIAPVVDIVGHMSGTGVAIVELGAKWSFAGGNTLLMTSSVWGGAYYDSNR